MSLRNKIVDIKSLKEIKEKFKKKKLSYVMSFRFTSCRPYKLFSISKEVR